MAVNDNGQLNEQQMFSTEEQNQLQAFLTNFETTVDTNLSEPQNSCTNTNQTDSDKDGNSSINKRKRRASSQKTSLTPATTATTSILTPTTAKIGRARKAPHELLSEDQKKANHIASEQKRRANIRIGFDQLVETVPTLDNCHRSESVILQKSVDYIKELLEDKSKLKERVRELQLSMGDVPDEDSSEGELDDKFIYTKKKP